jgi:adenylate cyclase
MARSDIGRRLAAILAADVVGYSRLMGEDEAGTLARLKLHRKTFIAPLVDEHHGRVVKLMGDGALVEFASAVEAVQCAVRIQEGMVERERDVPDHQRIRFRLGINLGDVIFEDDDIYGDGVNVAARLEALAEPGGICVTDAIHDQVRGKLPFLFDDLGAYEFKNITRPIRVFRVRPTAVAGEASAPSGRSAEPPTGVRTSIAVLPFANMSGDQEHEFFADGLTEDIITELSRFHELFVISRNSTFVHKGKAVNVREVARGFGVQYVVEGSVRRAGNRVRVIVQLIDGESGRHVWADRYDRELDDIFAVQDEITSAIVATLPARVEAAAHDRVQRKRPESMAAYECVLAAKVLHHRSTPADNAEARRLLARALALEPTYAHAHAWKACVLGQSWVNGWCQDRDGIWNEVVAELATALELDDNDADVHRILAAVNVNTDDLDKAAYHQERALALNPNNDLIVVQQGEILTWLGRPEEGIEWIRKAMRLNPYHPERFWNHLGRAYFVARRYSEAVEAFRRISKPDHLHHAFLAAAQLRTDNAAGAALHAQAVLAAQPGFRVEDYLATLHYRRDGDRDHHRRALLDAGLPP